MDLKGKFAVLLIFVIFERISSQIIRPSPALKKPKTTMDPNAVLLERWEFPLEKNVAMGSVSTSACLLSEAEIGVCRPITDCPEVLRRFGNKEPVRCSFKGDEPVVCCPKPERKTESLVEANDFVNLRVPGCGVRPFKSKSKRANPLVVGGWESIPYSWPWMVAVLILGQNGEWLFHCGGVLIGKRYVLTAAHCFGPDLRKTREPDALKYAIRIKAHDRDNGTIIELDRIIVHENYVLRESYYDLALLKTFESIDFKDTLRPVCLPGTTRDWGSLENVRAIVTGWGDLAFGGASSQVLREVRLSVYSNSECAVNYERVAASAFPHGISNILLCAGVRRGGKDACQGDSGGPLVYKFDDEYSVIGIVSFGYGCAKPGFPGVYTRVSAFLDWILKNTNGLN